jgi:ribosome recycling factor
MTTSEQFVKDLDAALAGVVSKFKQELGQIRSNRPSPDMVQDLKVSVYDQMLSIRELGSLSVLPPRTIQITLWDAAAVGAVAKAIEQAHLGLSVTNDGNSIRATLSPLGNERREEMTKLVKKTAEAARIQVRGKREEAVKRIKEAETGKTITQDDAFKSKEKVQKAVDKANSEVEAGMEAKLNELGE